MKQIIGFATQYYTLWDYYEEVKYVVDSLGNYHPSYTEEHYIYIKNISIDINKVIEMHPNVRIDDQLRGISHTFSRNREEDLSPSLIKFGKYNGLTIEQIADCDMDYLLWVIGNEKVSAATRELIGKLPQFLDYCTTVAAEQIWEQMCAPQAGLYFNDGARVDIQIKEVKSFGFETAFGYTHICLYTTPDRREFKYMGSTPPEISKEEFTTVKATIKHDNYKGQDETKLQRIKILQTV